MCNCEGGLAVIIIAHPKRIETTLPLCVESVVSEAPDEILVVGDNLPQLGVPILRVADITRTTIDALVKRDAGFVATQSHNICYLADDHRLAPGFVQTFRDRYQSMDWDLLAPSRFTVRGLSIFPLNVGKEEGYIGGHCGIYRRPILRRLPWTATKHHPNWDVYHSHGLVQAGGVLSYAKDDLAVEDIEPGARPWM